MEMYIYKKIICVISYDSSFVLAVLKRPFSILGVYVRGLMRFVFWRHVASVSVFFISACEQKRLSERDRERTRHAYARIYISGNEGKLRPVLHR